MWRDRNRLRTTCRVIMGNVTILPKSNIGAGVGRLDGDHIMRRKTHRVERFRQLFAAGGGME